MSTDKQFEINRLASCHSGESRNLWANGGGMEIQAFEAVS